MPGGKRNIFEANMVKRDLVVESNQLILIGLYRDIARHQMRDALSETAA